jgi:murein DD-endopeptidase MepM/ murein hydrolase activator NlpD
VLRLVLMLLAGVLVGANLVYFAMTRNSGANAGDALRAPEATPATRPADATVSAAGMSPATAPGAMVPPGDDARPASNVERGPWIAATPTPRRPRPAAPAPPLPPTATATAPDAAGTPLAMPLPNLRPSQLLDTYADPRGSSRQHEALDIMAPAGTPVLAVADGRIAKLFTSDQGGLTLYQFDPSGRYAYYYAHLLGYAAGLAENQQVRRGQVLGYVGSTGNANPDAPHLHFAVFVLGPEKQWWKGTPINPYPLLGGRPAVPGAAPGQ